MKRIIIFGLAIVTAACSSSSAPKDIYSGNWIGTITESGNSITINTTTSQSGSAGSGAIMQPLSSVLRLAARTTTNFTCSLSGTSTPPALNFTMNFNDSEVIVFTGNYASSDSVSGTLTESSDTIAVGFGFKKQ